MQAKTSTPINLFDTKTVFVRFSLIPLFLLAFIFMSQHANAQLKIGYEDLEGFAPVEEPQLSLFSTEEPEVKYDENQDPMDRFQSIEQSPQRIARPIRRSKSLGLNMVPNPVTNHATIIKDADLELKKIEVIDLQGNLLFSGGFKYGFVNIPFLEPGIYNFMIYTNYGLATKLVSIN